MSSVWDFVQGTRLFFAQFRAATAPIEQYQVVAHLFAFLDQHPQHWNYPATRDERQLDLFFILFCRMQELMDLPDVPSSLRTGLERLNAIYFSDPVLITVYPSLVERAYVGVRKLNEAVVQRLVNLFQRSPPLSTPSADYRVCLEYLKAVASYYPSQGRDLVSAFRVWQGRPTCGAWTRREGRCLREVSPTSAYCATHRRLWHQRHHLLLQCTPLCGDVLDLVLRFGF